MIEREWPAHLAPPGTGKVMGRRGWRSSNARAVREAHRDLERRMVARALRRTVLAEVEAAMERITPRDIELGREMERRLIASAEAEAQRNRR